jgi:hypothetical protein
MLYENKDDIATALYALIYEGDGDYTLEDIEDIVGDGDLFEYI